MNKHIKTLSLGLGILAIASLFYFADEPNNPEESFQERFAEDYNIYAIKLPKGINFAGEELPKGDNDVLERLDRELHVNTYWQSNSLLMFKRANKFFPIIEPILKRNNIPEDFKYLALTESALQQVVSPAGATGFWQIMRSTGKELGLEINSEVDERYHIEKSTEAACEYLKQAYEKFGSWTLVAASYNMGMSGLDRALREQKVKNYYDLLLNSETSRYVFRIHALKEIMENPSKYGFNFTKEDLYSFEPTQKLEITQPIEDLASFAKHLGINYKILKRLNPWLRDDKLSMRYNQSYVLDLPANIELPKNLYQMEEDTVQYGAKKEIEDKDIVHFVRSGDNLTAIANRYNVKVSDIINWNKLRNANDLKIGQKLIIKQSGE